MAEDASYMFSGISENDKFTNVTTFENLDTIKSEITTNMSHMFSGMRKIVNLSLPGLDTSKVTNMDYMFSDCDSLQRIYVGQGKIRCQF